MVYSLGRIGGWFLDSTVDEVKDFVRGSSLYKQLSRFRSYSMEWILVVERYVCSDEEDDDYMVSRGGAYGGYMGGYYEAGDEGECYTDDSEEDSEDDGM